MHIVVIAGGDGMRLWPLSRAASPKPFISLEDGVSLLQHTILRSAAIDDVKSLTLVINEELYFRAMAEHVNLPCSVQLHYILEPVGRDTTAAICAANLEIKERYGDESIVLILPADHMITEEQKFFDAVNLGRTAAEKNELIVFGIKPNNASSEFGYLKIKFNAEDVKNKINKVEKFVEKPASDLAKYYFSKDNYYWNAGMFCFRAQVLYEELDSYEPEVLHSTQLALNMGVRSDNSGHTVVRLNREVFEKIYSKSIDYSLFEKSKHVSAVLCDFGWCDIGTWKAVAEMGTEDDFGNRFVGQVVIEDSHRVYIRSPDRLTVAVGVEDLIIVDTSDALLVVHKDRSHEVKKVVQQLKDKGSSLHQHHVTVHRPWGSYTVLEEGIGFKIKRIVVSPGASLSLQMHFHRSEHWIVVHGTARIFNNDKEILLQTNESTYIEAGNKHRLENPGIIPLIIIEVQSGQYLGEDDIVRFEDNYGRI